LLVVLLVVALVVGAQVVCYQDLDLHLIQIQFTQLRLVLVVRVA
jgi:hypothetical protein